MKFFSTLFFTFFFAVISYAQTTVLGKITDADGQPIPSASVTIEEPGKDAIMAYSISNSKGEYKVTFTSAEPNVDLKIKAFNQKPLVKSIKNQNQTLSFSMDSDATEIKEVKLKTKLITKKGDTISYDLKAFESKADRTLADVLKKIPGIEVNGDGSVLYQGEPINKFYINGKDLMEGGYGTVNNSLPKDAVQKVEVLENHQPVKILQDKVPSENAALNVVLKKTVTMTGRGEVGVGMDPLLWNVKLTPMFFGQKNQWVVNYKANNNGESVEKEGNLLSFGSRWEGRRTQASQKSWTNLETADVPNVPEKRYLQNNVHYFSANLLTNPFKSKEWELKANASYTNNSIERRDNRIEIFQPDSPKLSSGGELTSFTSNNFYTNATKGEVIFTKNAKKGFFKNTTTWNGFWNESNAETQRNIAKEDQSGNTFSTNYASVQGLNSPSGMIQNSLSAILPWKEKLFNVMSYISYQKDQQTLSVSPSSYLNMGDNFPYALNFAVSKQFAKSNTFIANHSASVGFSYKKFTFTPEMGLNMSFNNLESVLLGGSNSFVSYGADYENNMDWNEVQPYTQVGINYKSSNFNFSANLPLNFYGITYKDHLRNQFLDNDKIVFEPSLFASYDFASFFKWWVFANQSYDFGNFGFLYGGQMLTSPVGLTKRYDDTNPLMPEYLSRNLGTRLEYRNPLNNLFFNVRYGYNTNKRNIIERFTGEGFSSQLSLAAIDNTIISRTESAEIGKYFPKFKTNASFNFSNTNSNGYTFFNTLVKTKSNRQNLGFKFNNTYFSWLSVDYNISMNWSESITESFNSSRKNSGWSHNLAAYVYPVENHTVGFFWDDLNTKSGGESFRNSFFDLSYQYTWSKKKIDFELKWMNIGNKKAFEDISYDPGFLLTTKRTMYIRPSQVMFTVKFNFK
ncbi:hypothetical protein CBW16_06025 [Flavobacteriaceae bacterium JJC]|nr:hypothetical protein CBW16_06025 [Flavobacteriaceae bacterium JJC]